MTQLSSGSSPSTSRAIHVGLMVPANNTTMEQELLGWLPPGSSCKTLRIPRGQGLLTDDTLPAYKQSAIDLCKQFAEWPIDVVAYGCTAAGFILGPEGDNDIARQLAATSGKPVVTTARAMMLALQEADIKNISLLTPYQDDVNQRLRVFLQSGQVSVGHFDSFYASDVSALGRIKEEEVKARAERLLHDDVDALFIACSQLPTLNIVEALGRRWGKPVLSSIQVTAHRAMAAVASS